MRYLRRVAGLDGLTLALLLGGVVLVAASLVGAAVLLSLPGGSASSDSPGAEAAAEPTLPADRVATVLYVDVASGAGSAARAGDHVDVLGYFAASGAGGANVTRLLLPDVLVLSVDRGGGSVALTLAVPQDEALLVQEAQALGGRPYVALRAAAAAAERMPPTFSDADLADRLVGQSSSALTARDR